MCRAKIWESYRGNIVTISTSYNATRVETGVLVPQIQAYKDRLSSMEGGSIILESVVSKKSELEELAAGNIDVRTLDYFVAGKMIGEHWICAKVRNISQNWWYISWLKCPKKVKRSGNNYHCEKHGDIKIPLFRYKIEMDVWDFTGDISLICWDPVFSKFVDGKSCFNLKNEAEEQGHDNLLPLIEGVVGKTLLFKILVKPKEVSGYSGSYTVNRIIGDEKLVEKFNQSTINVEDSDFLTMLQKELKGGYESEEEVSTPLKEQNLKEIVGDSSVKRALFEEGCSSSKPLKQQKVNANNRGVDDDSTSSFEDTDDVNA
ncbi:nucleic acid-binding [Striga asiatica]|uniref:Nucleic acid-binding n=1 Tax=Striga asiatica TaxID=4170 RepID=A0A5A7QHM3_STRAF|nr:nucleic acid-binding [Striga asiatica]